MTNSSNRLRYDLDSYDRHYCLKPPAGFTASLLFLCKSLLLPFVMYVGSMVQSSSGFGVLIYGVNPVLSLVSAVPALLVFYALLMRKPNAGRHVRWLWSNAKVLIATSVVLQAAPVIKLLATSDRLGGDVSSDDVLQALVLLLDVLILIYILSSRRVRDTLHNFPVAAEQ